DASALAVRSGKIAYVGDDAGAQGWIGKNTRVLRVKGVTVLPGLIDTHIHLMDGALTLDYCTLSDKELTLAQIVPLVRECAERTPGAGWVVVLGLNGAGFKADLKSIDAIVPARPLLLWGADGH